MTHLTRVTLLTLGSIFVAGCARARPPTVVDTDWAGTWGPATERSTAVGYLELETFRTTGQPPSEFQLLFSQRDWPEESLADCHAEGPLAAVLEVTCSPRPGADEAACPRRIRLVRTASGFDAELLGPGWAPPCAAEERPRSGKLLRVDPFEAMVQPFIDDARHSDLGSAGGRIFYVALGDDPPAAVRGLARSVQQALQDRGVQTKHMRQTTAAALVSSTAVKLLTICGFMPAARQPADVKGRKCTMEQGKAAADDVAADYQAVQQQLQRDIDGAFPADGG